MTRLCMRAIALLLLVCVLTSDAAAPAKVKPAGAAGAPPTKPATQPLGSKPKVNSGKPGVVKPVVKPGAKPVAKPATKPEVKPAAKPVAKPGAKPAAGHAKTNATLNAATATAVSKPCMYDAKDTVGFTGRIYVKGAMFTPDSVYAVCTNGKHLCYADDDTSDGPQGSPVKCPPKEAAKPTLLSTPKAKATMLGAVKPASKIKVKRELSVHMTGERTWPHGVVCYTLDSSFTKEQRDNMIESWDTYTPLGFKIIDLKTGCKAEAKRIGKPICNNCRVSLQVLVEEQANVCETTLGYSNVHERTMRLGASCHDIETAFRTYVHEMGHALGLMHEHQHPDIPFIIARDRIQEGAEKNYARIARGAAGMTHAAYDAESVMHYTGEFREFCMPDKKFEGTVWCDVFEDEGTNGCVIPLASHCAGLPLRYFQHDISAGDTAALKELYWPTTGDAPQPEQDVPDSASESESESDGEGFVR